MKNHLKRKLHKTDTSEDSAVQESDETCHTKQTQLSEDSAVEETGEVKVTQI